MSAPASCAQRFVVFSTIDDEPWDVGASLSELLDRARELASLGIGLVRFTEVLDCGDQAADVVAEGTPLSEARLHFPTVFRGDGVAEMMPVARQAALESIPANGEDVGVRLWRDQTSDG